LVGFIVNKFVRNFTYICRKISQICVKCEESCLVGSTPGVFDHASNQSMVRDNFPDVEHLIGNKNSLRFFVYVGMYVHMS
jgi:hypothetical protein